MADTKPTKKHEAELENAPKGVPPAQMTSADADKVGKEKKVEIKPETKVEEKKETKTEDKKETAQSVPLKGKKDAKKAKEIPKKDVAIANGYSLKISPKQSIYVCRIIRGKSPEGAIHRLQEVIDEKRPVPMAGLEVGHKKGKGLAGGRFPKNACKAIMEIVKQVGANAIVAGIENPIIAIAKSDRASAPYRKDGRKAKRTHMHIEVRERRIKL